jgi:hypothetical protein
MMLSIKITAAHHLARTGTIAVWFWVCAGWSVTVLVVTVRLVVMVVRTVAGWLAVAGGAPVHQPAIAVSLLSVFVRRFPLLVTGVEPQLPHA